MHNSNSKKTAIVTGSSRGIGKAIAIELLNQGYHVYICSRTLKDLKDTCSNISHFGKAEYFQLDIADKSQLNKFLGEWKTPLNVLVNNAGICGIEKLEEDIGLWDDILNLNLNGVYFLTKGLLKWISGGGSIVNISSQLGMEGRSGFGAYCATKHAILGLTKCWAKELGEKGITVNAICPGWVKTEMAMADVKEMAQNRSISEEEMYREITKDLDLKRFIEPEEIAYLVAFLVSEQGRGITGQSYLIR